MGTLASSPRRIRLGGIAFPSGDRAADAPESEIPTMASLSTIWAFACGTGWMRRPPRPQNLPNTFFAKPIQLSTRPPGNQAWAAAGYQALAEDGLPPRRLDGGTGAPQSFALRFDIYSLRARDLKVIVPHRLGCAGDAETLLKDTLAVDPLDIWARHLAGISPHILFAVPLGLAHDYAQAGRSSPRRSPSYRKIILSRSLRFPHKAGAFCPWLTICLDGSTNVRCMKKLAHKHYRPVGRMPNPNTASPRDLRKSPFSKQPQASHIPETLAHPITFGNLLYDRRLNKEAHCRVGTRSVKLDSRNLRLAPQPGHRLFQYLQAIYQGPAPADNCAFRADPKNARSFVRAGPT